MRNCRCLPQNHPRHFVVDLLNIVNLGAHSSNIMFCLSFSFRVSSDWTCRSSRRGTRLVNGPSLLPVGVASSLIVNLSKSCQCPRSPVFGPCPGGAEHLPAATKCDKLLSRPGRSIQDLPKFLPHPPENVWRVEGGARQSNSSCSGLYVELQYGKYQPESSINSGKSGAETKEQENL